MADASSSLSDNLRQLGFQVGRFKTGTPCRLNSRSIDFSRCAIQPGDEPLPAFSFYEEEIGDYGGEIFTLNRVRSGKFHVEQMPCWITHTTQKLVPDVGYKPTYHRFAERMVFKTHESARPDYRHVIFLVRDARDVMVSLLHYEVNLTGKPLESFDLVEHVRHHAPAWRNHVKGWLNNASGAHLMTVRYEDLSADCVKELERLCAFMEIKRDRKLLGCPRHNEQIRPRANGLRNDLTCL